MDIQCTRKELAIFKTVSDAAGHLGYPCYLIGGFVGDKILGRQTKDADFVCVGDALQLATEVSKKFVPHPRVSLFKTFGTAQFRLPDHFRTQVNTITLVPTFSHSPTINP